MDEQTPMGPSLRGAEDEETIDLMELARLLWAHIVQIVAAAVAAALICLLVCMFALTPQVSGFHQHDREHPAGHDHYLHQR